MTLVFLRRLLISALALGVVFQRTAEADEALGKTVVVVYNVAAPESKALAEYYARRRGIDPSHLVGLASSQDDWYHGDVTDIATNGRERGHWRITTGSGRR
jgi:hypothetical protein